MKIGEYVHKYTAGKPITFRNVTTEIREYWSEFQKFNLSGMNEEAGDVLHFLQLWLYWKFGLNGNIWKSTQKSVDKYIARSAPKKHRQLTGVYLQS